MVARARTRTTPPEIDEAVLLRARRGDPQALRAVVERYHRPVYQLLWRMVEHTAGAHRVEELSQETFLRVCRALPRFDPAGGARLSTWIFTIASRLALNERRRKRPPLVAIDDRFPAPERADDGARRAEVRDAVRAALADLEPPFRLVLVLRAYHDLDYDEISEILDVPPGTVKSRLSRARAALREALREVHDG